MAISKSVRPRNPKVPSPEAAKTLNPKSETPRPKACSRPHGHEVLDLLSLKPSSKSQKPYCNRQTCCFCTPYTSRGVHAPASGEIGRQTSIREKTNGRLQEYTARAYLQDVMQWKVHRVLRVWDATDAWDPEQWVYSRLDELRQFTITDDSVLQQGETSKSRRL